MELCICTKDILLFLNSTGLQTLVVVVSVVVTVWHYNKTNKELRMDSEKLDKKILIDSAGIILYEIKQLEKAFTTLCKKSPNRTEDITQVLTTIYDSSPIYQQLNWFETRKIFIGKIDVKSINELDNFYNSVIRCEETRKEVREVILLNYGSRIENFSRIILNIAKKESAENYISKIKDFQTKAFNLSCGIMIQNEPVKLMENAFDNFHNINICQAKKALEKLSK